MVMYVRNAQLESTCLTSDVQDQDLALVAQLDITHQIRDEGGVRFAQWAITKAVPDKRAASLVLSAHTSTWKEPLLAKNAQLENTQKLPDKQGVWIAQWAITKAVPDNQAANLVLPEDTLTWKGPLTACCAPGSRTNPPPGRPLVTPVWMHTARDPRPVFLSSC